eukprot:jgi/Tetstr1/434082/TSEL_023226.t1
MHVSEGCEQEATGKRSFGDAGFAEGPEDAPERAEPKIGDSSAGAGAVEARSETEDGQLDEGVLSLCDAAVHCVTDDLQQGLASTHMASLVRDADVAINELFMEGNAMADSTRAKRNDCAEQLESVSMMALCSPLPPSGGELPRAQEGSA